MIQLCQAHLLACIVTVLYHFTVLGSTVAPVAEKNALRIAVIEQDLQIKSAGAFVDFLELALNQSDRVDCLEREKLDDVVAEKLRGLIQQQPRGDEWIPQAGQLLSVDIFILIEPASETGTDVLVSWVESEFGMVLNRIQLKIHNNTEAQKTAQWVARETVERMTTLPEDLRDASLIFIEGVSYLDPEPDGRQALADGLQKAIEFNLTRLPDIFLAERRHTKPLMSERFWNSRIPRVLAPSALVVDLEYERSRQDESNIIVYLRVRKEHQELLRESFSGNALELGHIGQKIADSIYQVVAAHPREMNETMRKHEASLLRKLAADSRTITSSLDFHSSIGFSDAALALNPMDEKTIMNYLSDLHQWSGILYNGESFFTSPAAWEKAVDDVQRRYVQLFSRLLDLLRSDPGNTFVQRAHPKEIINLILIPVYRTDEQKLALRRQLLPMYREFFERYRSHHAGESYFRFLGLTYLNTQLQLDPALSALDIEEVLSILREVWSGAKQELDDFHYNKLLQKSVSLCRLGPEAFVLYQVLAKEPTLELRYIGHAGLVHVYAGKEPPPNPDRAQKEFLRYSDFLFRELFSQYPEAYSPRYFLDYLCPRAGYGYFFGENRQADTRFRAVQLNRIWRHVLGEIPGSVMTTYGPFGVCSDVLIEAGMVREAHELCNLYLTKAQPFLDAGRSGKEMNNMKNLERIVTRLKKKKYHLEQKYPEAFHATDIMEKIATRFSKATRFLKNSDPLTADLRLDTESMKAFIHNHGGSHQDAYPIGLLFREGRLIVIMNKGILQIDPNSFRPLRYSQVPNSFTLHSIRGPIDADKTGLYILTHEGILAFPWAGEASLLFPENALASGGRCLAVMDGKFLTATRPGSNRSGGHFSTLLVIHNVHSGSSRILFSTEASLRDQPDLVVQGIRSLFADHTNKRFLFSELNYTYAYYPESERFEVASIVPEDRASNWVLSGDTLITRSFGHASAYDSRTGSQIAGVTLKNVRFHEFSFLCELAGGILGIRKNQIFYADPANESITHLDSILFPDLKGASLRCAGLQSHPNGPLILIQNENMPAGLYQASSFSNDLKSNRTGSRPTMEPVRNVPDDYLEKSNMDPEILADQWLDNILSEGDRFHTKLSTEWIFLPPGWRKSGFTGFGSEYQKYDHELSINGKKKLQEFYRKQTESGNMEARLCLVILNLKHAEVLENLKINPQEHMKILKEHALSQGPKGIWRLVNMLKHTAHHVPVDFAKNEMFPVMLELATALEERKLIISDVFVFLDRWSPEDVTDHGGYLARAEKQILDPDYKIANLRVPWGNLGPGDCFIYEERKHPTKANTLPTGDQSIRETTLNKIREVYADRYDNYLHGQLP